MYVFDTNSLSVILKHYYPERFPSLWIKLNEMLINGDIKLVRESYNEIMKLRAYPNNPEQRNVITAQTK